MTKYYTLKDAFHAMGVNLAHPRQGWDARREDGTVVMALWADQFYIHQDTMTMWYSNEGTPDADWQKSYKNQARIKNMKHIQDNFNGYFRAIIVSAKDPTQEPRTIRHVNTYPHLLMRLAYFNETTGEFRAQRIMVDDDSILRDPIAMALAG